MNRLQINHPSELETQQALKQFRQAILEDKRRNEELAVSAKPAMARLVEVCRHKTGQGYKLRALLFSLWNGKPASLLEIVSLDRNIREDLLAVLRAFGGSEFFYDQVKAAFVREGLLEWFTDESEVEE